MHKPPARLELYLLGSPRVERAGAPVETDTRKAIALLAYLAVTGENQSREGLAALFWPDADESRAHAALRRTLSTLNKALGGTGLNIDREAVSLERGTAHAPSRNGLPVWVDVDQFHARLAECLTHSHPAGEVCPACLPPLTEAAALYRGDFLSGFTLRDSPGFDDWQFFQAETLRRELAGALERLVRCHTERREYDSAIPYARRWLALDPLHEPAHRQLMLLYAQSGQHAAALRQYRECVRVLEEELGVPPLEETTRLVEAIKEQRGMGVREHGSIGEPPPTRPHAHTPTLPLVGRTTEWTTLLNVYNSIHADGQLIVLEGEAGIGKTRLAEGFVQHARGAGAAALTARCYEGELNLAYGPFVEALRSALSQAGYVARLDRLPAYALSEASRLLPELAALRPDPSAPPSAAGQVLPPALPLESPGAQTRFFESISQLLLALCGGPPPGLLYLDDLHWADEASLDLLTYLVRRLRGRAVCLLITWRGGQLPENHRLLALLAEAQRAGAGTHLPLSRLSLASVTELVRSALPSSETAQPSSLIERLYHETEGLPFFLVEYLATMTSQKPGFSDAEGEWPLPVGVRGLLQSRLGTVGETGRQLLSAAAVIGRSFDFDTLREASGRSDEEAVSALEELVARGLVAEVEGGDGALTYDFSHEKLRTLVYAETSLARRRLLHRRVAEALVARNRRGEHEGRGGPRARPSQAGLIAQHYRWAGLAAEAAHYFKLAGEHTRTLYANAEALAHFRAALALGHPETATLHESIGDLQTLSGDYGAALTSYEAAAALCPPGSLANLEHKLGKVYHRRGDWELAESHFQAALKAMAEESSSGARARLYADWSLTAHHDGQPGQARTLARRALELAEAAGDQRARAQAHNILGVLASSQHDLAKARHHLEQSLALAQALGDPGARVAALNNLALAFSRNGEIDQALKFTEQALVLCAVQGDRHREAALHNNLADLLHTAGRSEAAMAHLKQAVALFAEIGTQAGDMQPEIWKLTEW